MDKIEIHEFIYIHIALLYNKMITNKRGRKVGTRKINIWQPLQ